MPPKKYRITSPTIAMFREDGHHVAHMVPTGAIVTVVDSKPFDGERLMDVKWDDRVVMMFTADLRARTEEWNEK